MKQIVLTFSDVFYEKLRFEAMHEKKDIHSVVRDRVLFKSFHPDVEKAFDEWVEKSINQLSNDNDEASNEY